MKHLPISFLSLNRLVKRLPAALFVAVGLLGVGSSVCAQQPFIQSWAFQPSSYPTGVAYSTDDSVIAVGSGSSICLYSSATELPYSGISAKSGYAFYFKFSPDGKTLAIVTAPESNSGSNVVEFWSYKTGKFIGQLTSSSNAISSLAFSPSGGTLAIGGSIYNSATKTSVGILEEWNVSGRNRLFALKTKATQVNAVAYSVDGKYLAEGGVNGKAASVELWNAAAGTLAKNLIATNLTRASSVAFAPDGDSVTVLAAGAATDVIATWSLANGSLQSEVAGNWPAGSGGFLSRDGSQVAVPGTTTGMNDGEFYQTAFVDIYNVSNLQTPALSSVTGESIGGMAFSSDGSSLSVVGAVYSWYLFGDDLVFLPSGSYLDVLSNAHSRSIPLTDNGQWGPVGAMFQSNFSPDGKLVVAGAADYGSASYGISNALINVWNAATGLLVTALPTGSLGGVTAFSPDDTLLAVEGGNGASTGVQVWSLASGKVVGTYASDLTATAILFSPDGTKIAIGGSPGSGNDEIELWDLETGTLLESLKSEANNGICRLAFTANGATLLVGGSSSSGAANAVPDGVLEIWNVTTGDLVKELPTKESVVYDVTLSPDGKSVAASGETIFSSTVVNGTLELWSLTSEKLLSSLPLYFGTTEVAGAWFSANGKQLYANTIGGPGVLEVLDPINYKILGFLGTSGDEQIVMTRDATLGVSTGYWLGLSTFTIPPVASVSIKSLSIAQPSMPEFSSTTATVTLDSPAPAGGITLGIDQSCATYNPVEIPASITIPAGQRTGTFSITTEDAFSSDPVTITVLSGLHSVFSSMTVNYPELGSVTLSANSVIGGGSLTGTVTVANQPGLYGSFVSFSANNPAVNNLYDIYVNSPGPSQSFTLTTNTVTVPTPVILTFSLGGVTKTVSITVNPSG